MCGCRTTSEHPHHGPMRAVVKPAPRWTIVSAYVGGVLLAVVPSLVELVMGDFIVLLPVGLVLALAVVWPLRGGAAHRAFVVFLALALVTEFGEQLVFPDEVPRWADVAPPLFFTLCGVALVMAARALSRQPTAAQTSSSPSSPKEESVSTSPPQVGSPRKALPTEVDS